MHEEPDILCKYSINNFLCLAELFNVIVEANCEQKINKLNSWNRNWRSEFNFHGNNMSPETIKSIEESLYVFVELTSSFCFVIIMPNISMVILFKRQMKEVITIKTYIRVSMPLYSSSITWRSAWGHRKLMN